jgi:hypothetical protein
MCEAHASGSRSQTNQRYRQHVVDMIRAVCDLSLAWETAEGGTEAPTRSELGAMRELHRSDGLEGAAGEWLTKEKRAT